jgi:hypothetical protein
MIRSELTLNWQRIDFQYIYIVIPRFSILVNHSESVRIVVLVFRVVVYTICEADLTAVIF